MKRHISLIAILALAACASTHSPPAEAGTSTLSWVNPTKNTDGSNIVDDNVDETSLASWRIEFGTCSAGNVFGTKVGEVIRTRPVAGSLTGGVINTASGLKCFRVLVTNKSGKESLASNVASRTVESPTPNAPTNVTVAE